MGSVWALSVVIPIFASNMLPVPPSMKNVTNHLLMVSMPLRARLEDTVSWTAEVLCFVVEVSIRAMFRKLRRSGWTPSQQQSGNLRVTVAGRNIKIGLVPRLLRLEQGCLAPEVFDSTAHCTLPLVSWHVSCPIWVFVPSTANIIVNISPAAKPTLKPRSFSQWSSMES